MLITRLLLFPLVEWMFWRYLRRPYLELQRKLDKGWWLFAAIGGAYYLLIMVTSVPVGTPMPDAAGMIRIILVLIMMPLTYLTVLRSLWQQMSENQARTELEILSTRNRLTLENLRILQDSGRALAQARHDILGNLGILQSLSRQGEYDKLDEYLARITQQTSQIVPLKITGHPIVNAILSQSAERAKSSGVELRCQVDLPDKLTIPDEDLAAFLMNLMNNALDAAEELHSDRPRWVEITMHIRGRYLFIEGRNTYAWALEPGRTASGISPGRAWATAMGCALWKRWPGDMRASCIHRQKMELFWREPPCLCQKMSKNPPLFRLERRRSVF